MKSGASGHWIVGLIAMGALLAAGAFLLMHDDSGETHSFRDSRFDEDRGPGADTRTVLENRIHGDVEDASEGKLQDRTEVEAEGEALQGRVVERETGRAVPDFEIEVLQERDGRFRQKIMRTSVHDPEGRFRVPLGQGGIVRIFVLAEGFALNKKTVDPSDIGRTVNAPHYGMTMDAPADASAEDPANPKGAGAPSERDEGKVLLVELERGYVVSGIVIDAETEARIEGAVVVAATDELRDLAYIDPEALRLSTISDASGRFELQGVRSSISTFGYEGRVTIIASHPGFAQGYVATELPVTEPVAIGLHTGFRLFGRTFDDEGRPKADVSIAVGSDEIPMPIMVSSDSEGRYETGLVPRGRVRVMAHAPNQDRAHWFTEETRLIEIEDRDVELNFGPGPDYVTWQGNLRGSEGATIAGAKVELRLLGESARDPGRTRMKRVFYSDDAGAFEVRKLVRGVYTVDVFLFNPQCRTECENLSLHDAGSFLRKDIRLSGAEIAGKVIDGWTGKPMRGKSGTVHATLTGPLMKGFSSRINGRGRFRLIGLPRGVYDITAAVEGFPPQYIHGLRLLQGEARRDLDVVISGGGKVLIRFEGFKGLDVSSYEMSLEHEDGRVLGFPKRKVDPAGAWVETHPLESGRWKVCLYFEDLGYLEREFDILHGETTRVVIGGGGLEVHPGFVTLSGRLLRAGGEPMPGTTIGFYADRVPGLDEPGMRLMADADAEGRFEVDGVKPGRWNVRVLMPGGGEAVLPDLVVPHEVSDTFYAELVYPGGVVRGELYDADTGRPFSGEAEAPRWWVYLHDVNTRKSVSELQGGHKGSRFRLEGVPVGTLQLTVSALGYIDYRSEAFAFGGGELDVGRIELHPCGIVDLEVFTSDDRPINDFEVLCGDRKLSNQNRQYLSPGKYRYYQVPLGPTEIRIRVEGYPSQSRYIDLSPGTPKYVRIILP